MLEKSSDILKMALAIAALLVGLSVSYYYILYLPSRDQRAAEDREAARKEEKEQANRARLAAEKLRADKRANYNVCLSLAQATYNSRWEASCRERHSATLDSFNQCVAADYGAAFCKANYKIEPEKECSLPNALADDYDVALREAKRLCLDEFNNELKVAQ